MKESSSCELSAPEETERIVEESLNTSQSITEFVGESSQESEISDSDHCWKRKKVSL